MDVDARVTVSHSSAPFRGRSGACVLGNQATASKHKSSLKNASTPTPRVPLLHHQDHQPPKIRVWIHANVCLSIRLTSACGHGNSTQGKRDEGRRLTWLEECASTATKKVSTWERSDAPPSPTFFISAS